jgi:hypothetical protein
VHKRLKLAGGNETPAKESPSLQRQADIRNLFAKAALKAGIPLDHMDAKVALLSSHFGWDLMAGAKSRRGG